ncbi:MAG: helix-turn-helix domain-containing protein [Alphaproteobacteria bacterium]|nr:helix-turn-helix domain-containing protein [Alphaproteobacteria bacterium]
MNNLILEFSVLELGALLGLIQSVYILVYIFFRSSDFKRAVFPVLFFLTIAAAFFIIIAQKHWQLSPTLYTQVSLFLWTLCAPLSAFMVVQIARITRPPPLSYSPFLLLVPLSFIGFNYFAKQADDFDLNWLFIINIVVGSFSLLMIWLKREDLDHLHKRKNGKERFWLIMALITLNLGLIAANFVYFNTSAESQSYDLMRVIIGISFLYITATSLFRVYPPTLAIVSDKKAEKSALTQDEVEISLEIENLLHVQKVYQEPSYGRSNMAKELNINESQLSRIVNTYFQKNVPLLLNTLRVEEAKTLLVETQADISTISEESGFNSIATFNRVFKDIAGLSPTEYRAKYK